MKHVTKLLGVLVVLALGLAALADGQSKSGEAPTPREIADAQRPAYPLTTCVVAGEELGEDAVETVVDGRLYRLCCSKCKSAVKADPEKFAAKVVAAVIADQKPRYPLTTCAVSGEPLGSMGDPIEHVVGTKLVRLCCKGCTKAVERDPAKVLATVDDAWIQAQLPMYPLDTCLVMKGDPLEDPEVDQEPIDMLYGTTLVRLCCKSCIKRFHKAPAEFLADLEEARAAAKE